MKKDYDFSQIEKLVLRGYFERSEKTKKEERKSLRELGQITAKTEEILAFKNQDFYFQVNMLYFNPDSGIFIAKADDLYGEAVLYGMIGEIKESKRKIKFKKIYMGRPKHQFSMRRADSVDYTGLMELFEGRISCDGTWETHKNSPENGTWILSTPL